MLHGTGSPKTLKIAGLAHRFCQYRATLTPPTGSGDGGQVVIVLDVVLSLILSIFTYRI